MPYKDPNKQKEVMRTIAKRHSEKQKKILEALKIHMEEIDPDFYHKLFG